MGYILGMKGWLHCTLILLLLNGCASRLPLAITEPPAQSCSVRQAQQDPDTCRNRPVRWGGEIIEVQNQSDHSDVLVLGRALKKQGEPKSGGTVDGRFIARFGSFMDPAELPKGKRITVSGPLIGLETRKVGEYPYPYPVVQVTVWHLWPDPQPESYPYDPWWPYYPYPWYPGGPWGHPWWW